jgi:hypothetical protein
MNAGNAHIGQRSVDDERLDSVIDAVAREMTEFEPSASMRARVIERIEQGRRHPSHLVPRWAWTGAAAAVLLAVATAIWVAGPAPARKGATTAAAVQASGGRPPAAATSTRPPARPVSESAEAAGTAAGAAAGAATGARINRAATPRRARAASVEPADDVNRVPALADIEPLRFGSVEPDPIRIAAVTVAPFPEMTPIDIPGLGPNSNDTQSADPKKEK